MNIVAANQQFAVHGHSVLHSGRLEQISSKGAIKLPAPAAPPQSSLTPTAASVLAKPTADEKSGTVASPESTPSAEQNEDKQRFNALQTVGAVKRILDQLNAGKLLSWIDGTSMEKIQAQVAEQQSPATAPAGTAQIQAPAVQVTEWSYRYQELNANFSGELSLADGRSFQWSVDLAMRDEQFSFRSFTQTQLQDPLILSFGGNAAELADIGAAFDFFGTGQNYQLPDLGEGQYYLMRDINNNQQLDSGLELFGPRTGQGFAELAELDNNQNSFVEASDAQWQSLHLWSRQHGMQSLQQAGIKAISAESVATSFGLYDGDALLGRIARSGIFIAEQDELTNYQVGLVQQVDLNI